MLPRLHLLLAGALLSVAACAEKDEDEDGDDGGDDYGDCDPDYVDSLPTSLDVDSEVVGCLDPIATQDECEQLWADLSENDLVALYTPQLAEGFELNGIDCGPMWLDGACCGIVDVGETPPEDEDDGVDEGRPFLVASVRRQAPVADGQGWSTASEVAPVPAAHRAALAAHWTRMGQMEHASVAAFARFSMALMHHGAPADLVRDAHVAALDEVRHAQVCFGLAEAIGGSPIAPAGLDMTGALEGELDLERMTRTLVAEGCVGETLAALQVAEAARRARAPSLKALLEGIAADETRHAALAWRTLAWLVAEHPHLADIARSALTAAAAVTRVPARSDATDALADHGCLDRATRAHVRNVGLRDVVATLAEETLGQAAVVASAVEPARIEARA